ncbi:MAG: SelB C-terminal domain-containing protein [Dehalococcoidia bacterium]
MLHIGTTHSEARIKLLGIDELNKNIEGLCQIQLFQPISINQFDNFIIRFSGETIAGGEILRTATYKYNRFNEKEIYRLREISKRNVSEMILAAITDRKTIQEGNLSELVHMNLKEMKQNIDNLISLNKITYYKFQGNNFLVTTETIEKLKKQVTLKMEKYFEKNKLKNSIHLQELTQKMNIEEHLLYQVIEQIDVINTDNGHEFYLTNIKNQLTRKQSLLLKETIQQIKAFNLHPVKINTSKELQIILATKKEVKIIEKNLYLYEKNYEDAKIKIVDLLKNNSKVTLAQVRDFLGINRKVAQFILENMDEEHITIRKDKYRILFK